MSDPSGFGLQTIGQGLSNLSGALTNLYQANQRVSNQELITAQRQFNTQYNDWLAKNLSTRWDKIGQSYEDWTTAVRDSFGPDAFSSDQTRETFNSWMEEAISGQRVKVLDTYVVQQRQAYESALMQDNVNAAVAGRDVNELYRAVQAGVADGTIPDYAADNVMAENAYKINLANTRDAILKLAETNGYDNAVAALDEMFARNADGTYKNPDVVKQLQYVIGVDSNGNPKYGQISPDDIQAIKGDIRQELEDRRKERNVQIAETNRQYNEQADQYYARARQSKSTTEMRQWLNQQATIDGFTADDRYKWIARLDALEPGKEPDPTSALAEANIMQGAIRGESKAALFQAVIEGLQPGADGQPVISPSRASSLISMIDKYGSDPIHDGLFQIINEEVAKNKYSPEVAALATQKVQSLWQNQWSVVGENGIPMYVTNGMSDADLFQSVRNEVKNAALAYGEADRSTNKAYSVPTSGIGTDNPLLPWVRDNAERLMDSVQKGEYTGVDLSNGADPRTQQLRTLHTVLGTLFQQQTGSPTVSPTGDQLFIDQNEPVFVGRGVIRETGYPNDPANLTFRYTTRGILNRRKVLQVWDEKTRAWVDANISRSIGAGGDYMTLTLGDR